MNTRIRTNTESRVLSRFSPRLSMPAVARPRSPPRRRQGKLRAPISSSTSNKSSTDFMAQGLLKSTASVGAMTLISRILGFVRDMVVARTFGASTGADAFFVAFKIPNFLRRLFAEGAFSQAFVPVLTEYKTKRSLAEVKDLIDHVSGALTVVLFFVTLIGILAAPLLILLFAPGFSKDPTKFALASDMLRITFPYLLFISLTAFAGGILNAYGRFAVPAFTPTFLNLAIIGVVLWVAPHLDRPITALAWGGVLGGVRQLRFQWLSH